MALPHLAALLEQRLVGRRSLRGYANTLVDLTGAVKSCSGSNPGLDMVNGPSAAVLWCRAATQRVLLNNPSFFFFFFNY